MIPSSLPFLPTPHWRKSVVTDFFNLLAIERLERHQRHLDAGGVLHLAGIGFQLRARLRIQHVREVADIALRLERFEIEGRKRRGKDAENQRGTGKYLVRTVVRAAPFGL